MDIIVQNILSVMVLSKLSLLVVGSSSNLLLPSKTNTSQIHQTFKDTLYHALARQEGAKDQNKNVA